MAQGVGRGGCWPACANAPAPPPQVPLRSILVSATGNSLSGLPVCHDHCFAPDGFDLLIGQSTGDGTQLSQPQPLSFAEQCMRAAMRRASQGAD